MKKLKATVSSVLALTLISGCGAQTKDAAKATTAAQGATTAVAAKDGSVYPIAGNKKLTYWVGVTSPNTATNNDDIPVWQELQKRTGIDIQFVSPVKGQEKEQFNLMLASGDYPDIIESKEMEVGTLFDKGIIADLTDIMPKYSPNYYGYLQAHPDIMRQVKTDQGKMMVYPLLRPDPVSQTTTGPILRKDWLDKLGMQEPETIAEWEAVLTAFKEKLKVEVPFGGRVSGNVTNSFAPAFNFYLGFYHDNGTVKYGYVEPAFKEYMTTMAKWYANGLLDKNFASTDQKTQDANMLSNKQGASFGAVGGQVGTWMSGAKANGNTEFKLAVPKMPVLNKGDVPQYYDMTQFEYSNGNPWAMISSKCKDKETAARLLDYGYGEEGGKLLNYGIEGVSYNVVNGDVVPLSEDEVKAKFNMTSADFKKTYTRAADSGPFILSSSTLKYTQTPTQMQAVENWAKNKNKDHKMPPIILSPEESSEFTAIMADIKTYNEEMIVKFIMGAEPITNIDKYWKTVNGMNIKRAIEIQQKALDRYNKR